MNDFVFLNPKYLRGGMQRELCDLLLILKNEAIVISIKGTDDQVKQQTRLVNWLTKKTQKGANQAKGGLAWLGKVTLETKNLWDEQVSIASGTLKPVCGITLLDCSCQPFGSIEYEMRVPESETVIHILSVNDFLNVVNWLGSISDVFRYFRNRASVRDCFTGINQEQALLAYYTLVSKELTGFSMTDAEQLCVRHTLHLIENLGEYEARDKYANYVNSIVQAVHERHPELESYMPAELLKNIEPLEYRTSHREMAALFNALPMSTKAHIGRSLENMIDEVSKAKQAGCFAIKPIRDDMVFVFGCFSNISRTERIRHLHRMVPAALYQHRVSDGIGVAIDADDPRNGFDLTLIRGQDKFSEEDRRLGAYLFPNTGDVFIADGFGHTKQRGERPSRRKS
jgi:hypothetical protein